MRIRSLVMFAFVAAVLGISSQASAGNLVTNGSFETGDFTGWTQFGNLGFTGVTGDFSGIFPEDGFSQAYFGPVGSLGGISQDLATVAGQSYDISFYLYNFGDFGTGGTEYKAEFGSTVLTDVVNPPAFGYTEFTFVGTATGAVTTLALSFQQNPSYFLLDNVVVTSAVPEPSTLISGGIAVVIGIGCALRRRKSTATV